MAGGTVHIAGGTGVAEEAVQRATGADHIADGPVQGAGGAVQLAGEAVGAILYTH
jgi:hypothetical protein